MGTLSNTENMQALTSAASQARAPSRISFINRLNRMFGRMSVTHATASLTGMALLSALSLHILFGARELESLMIDSVVTIIVSVPIIYYAQTVIRQLSVSRRALREMSEKLAWAVTHAEQANAAKSSFLANMSHELRTPLNAIIGFSDIIKYERFGEITPKRYVDYGRDINDSGIHLLSIINDILDLAKIESGQAVLENETRISVVAAINAVCRLIRPLAEKHDVSIDIKIANEDIELLVVERMFRQVLMNILSNAIKFSPAKGRVTISSNFTPGKPLTISVSDNGRGMTAKEIEIALTPFGQVANGMTTNGGTGLGLPLSSAMMEMHGGELLVESEPGKGTNISLLFPSERVYYQIEFWKYLFAS